MMAPLASGISCVTRLSYTADGGGPDAGDAIADATAPCRRLVVIGGNAPDGGPPTRTVWFGDIDGTEIAWKEAPFSAPYDTAGAGALLVDGIVVTAGGFGAYDRYAAIDDDRLSNGYLPGPGAACTLGRVVPPFIHLLCSHNGKGGGDGGGFESAFVSPATPAQLSWQPTTASTVLQPGATSVPLAGGWLAVDKEGQAELGTPRAEDPRTITWKRTTPRPGPESVSPCAVGTGARAFFLGGYTSRAVVAAHLVASGDVVWTNSGLQELPLPVAESACISAGDRIWLIGGETSTNVFSDAVYSARRDGEVLGPWVPTTRPFPRAVRAAAVACLP